MSSAKFCDSLQGHEGDVRFGQMSESGEERPIFHPKLGALLAKTRAAKGWSVQQAVIAARGKKHTALTPNRLRWLEEGKTKAPDQDVLRAVCAIYDLDYFEIASAYIAANYGRDLVRQSTDQQSGSLLGDPDVATSRRIIELETKLRNYEAAIGELQNVLGTLGEIAVRLHEAGASLTATPKRRPRTRKAS